MTNLNILDAYLNIMDLTMNDKWKRKEHIALIVDSRSIGLLQTN